MRLGRGLSALMGEASAPAPASGEGVRTLPVEMLQPGPFQPRGPIDPGPLQELADSIREHGVLQPILVREKPGAPGEYEIIGGERRWRAAQLAQLHEVPVLLRNLDDTAAMAAAPGREPAAPGPQRAGGSRGLRRLIDEFGLTQDQARPRPSAKAAAMWPIPCGCWPCRTGCGNCCATAR